MNPSEVTIIVFGFKKKRKRKESPQPLFLMSTDACPIYKTGSITEQANKLCFVSLQKGSEESL